MKLRNRVISLVLALIMVISNVPVGLADETIPLVIKDDIMDFMSQYIEYGWGGTSYVFSEGVLEGVAEGDDVKLVATTKIVVDEVPGESTGSAEGTTGPAEETTGPAEETTGPAEETTGPDRDSKDSTPELAAGVTVTVEILDFFLSGADVDKYTLEEFTAEQSLRKEITIVQRTLKVKPEKNETYYGQPLPDGNLVALVLENPGRVIAGDDVTVSGSYVINNEGAETVGSYPMDLVDEVVIEGEDAANYRVAFDEWRFSIKAYDPGVTAVYPEGFTGSYDGMDWLVLHKPEDHLISLSGDFDAGSWGDEVSFPLKETQNGTYTYCLRNNVPGSPEYQAICIISVPYTCIQQVPEITRLTVFGAENGKTLKFDADGIITNGNLHVTVSALGAKVEQEMTIRLVDPDGNLIDKNAQVVKLDSSGRLIYETTFDITVADDTSKTWYPVAYAITSSGESSYPQAGSTDKYYKPGGWEGSSATGTFVTSPIIIDKKDPEVNFVAVQGNYHDPSIYGAPGPNAIRGVFNVNDEGTEVVKIEFLWDERYYEYRYGVKWKILEYREFIPDPSKENQEIILPYHLSATVDNNAHTLHIIVTDRAGNVKHYEKTGTGSGDTTPPNVNSVILKKYDKAGVEVDFAHRSDGIFHSGKLKLIISAEDVRGELDGLTSGVKYVKISEGAAWNPDEEGRDDEEDGIKATVDSDFGVYVLELDIGADYSDLYVTVVDVSLNTTKYHISELIPDLEKNVLILEDKKPDIDFGDTLDNAHKGPEDSYWFGLDDLNEELQINISDDKHGVLSSGMASQTILDNGKDITTYRIGSMGADRHVITVTAMDKAGNRNDASIIFGLDSLIPSIDDITFHGAEAVIIDECQWFKTDDVTIRVDASDVYSGLASIEVTVNGNIKVFNGNQILPNGKDGYVEVNLGQLGGHEANKYEITVRAWDYAGNDGVMVKEMVYVDRVTPTIEAVTAQTAGTIPEQTLNFLGFGLFSNDAIVFKVYASDVTGDSGVDKVVVDDGNMEYELPYADGCYYWKCDGQNLAYYRDLTFTVYDKAGRDAVAACGFSSADAQEQLHTSSTFVMIENGKPDVKLELPETDVVNKDIEEIWYNTTDEKIFTLTVQDEHSGIRSVVVTVNGESVTTDKDNVYLPTAELTAQAEDRNNNQQTYQFHCADLIQTAGVAADGKYEVKVVAEDNAGNTMTAEKTFYMDLSDPQITEIRFEPSTEDNISHTDELFAEVKIDLDDPEAEAVVEVVEYGYFFGQSFRITVLVADAKPSSGLYMVKYRLVPYENGEKVAEDQFVTGFVPIETDKPAEGEADQAQITGKAEIPVGNNFMGKIYLEVVDNVDRTSGELTTKGYVIDDGAPTIDIKNNVETDKVDAHGNALYVQQNSITVTISDFVSGLQKITYATSAEVNAVEKTDVSVGLNHQIGDKITDRMGGEWIVTGVNGNLVTQVQSTFVFAEDDNDVQMGFGAMDNARNMIEDEYSDIFTVDLTAPVIQVVFREDDDTDAYYNQNRVADIIVVERNFDPALINIVIENTFGNVPGYTFTSSSLSNHMATIDFDEGDYTLEVTGVDRGNHPAEVSYAGGNERLFYVDKTLPVVQHNFTQFVNGAENSFNVDKTATIVITEHNFDPNQTNLVIRRKDAGMDHTFAGLTDVTDLILAGARWSSRGDVHSIEFTFDLDAVYYIEIMPTDLASNTANKEAAQIFEIDKTAPVVSHKNDHEVWREDVQFLDIYRYGRKDDPAPTVTFQDLNISYIKYTLTTYIPEYVTSEIVTIDPKVTEGTVQGSKYVLPDFTEDGVYAVKLVAVDVAGNESLLNINTYSRMIQQDVLAFILDSDVGAGTGLYSLEYENGDPISKKPSDFQELKIFVMATKDMPVDIVLRGTNGDETLVSTSCEVTGNIYGIDVMTYTVEPDFFKESFRDDTDKELHLTVRTEKKRIDLASIHIDNIAPTCTFPEELQSWRWFAGNEDRTFVITDISEQLVEQNCKVFDNGQEVPFIYSAEEGTLTFTLQDGWHNIGAILTDAAGNQCIIQERNNIHIGYFWIILVAVCGVAAVSGVAGVIIYRYKRKRRELQES